MILTQLPRLRKHFYKSMVRVSEYSDKPQAIVKAAEIRGDRAVKRKDTAH